MPILSRGWTLEQIQPRWRLALDDPDLDMGRDTRDCKGRAGISGRRNNSEAVPTC